VGINPLDPNAMPPEKPKAAPAPAAPGKDAAAPAAPAAAPAAATSGYEL
jgi:pilus assembly protein CpaC